MNIDEIITRLVLLREEGCKTVKIYDIESEEDREIDIMGKPSDKDYVRIVPVEE